MTKIRKHSQKGKKRQKMPKSDLKMRAKDTKKLSRQQDQNPR